MGQPARKEDMMFVRLKPHDPRKRHVLRSYTVHGVQFREDRGWYEVPHSLAELLRNVPQQELDPSSPAAFDVCTMAEAEAIESREEAARRAAYERAQVREARPVGRRGALTPGEAATRADRSHTVTTADLPSSRQTRADNEASTREDLQRSRAREAELPPPDAAWLEAGNAADAEKAFDAIEEGRAAPTGKGAPPPPTVPKGTRIDDPGRGKPGAPARPLAATAQAKAALGVADQGNAPAPKVQNRSPRAPRTRGTQLDLPKTDGT